MASHFSPSPHHLKYKNKGKPKTGPIIIAFYFIIVFNKKKVCKSLSLKFKGFVAMQFCLTDVNYYWPIVLIHAANALKTALKLLYCIPDAFKKTFHYTF